MNQIQLLILLTFFILLASEHFRSLRDHPGYGVSNRGRVRNLRTGRTLATKTSNSGYKQVHLNRTCEYIHRLVATEWVPNPEHKACVDHIDGNKINNLVSNIRWATVTENMMNKSKSANRSSKFKGVSKHYNKWLVHICNQHVGVFVDERAAAMAYNNHAKEYFGVFAKLNQMD